MNNYFLFHIKVSGKYTGKFIIDVQLMNRNGEVVSTKRDFVFSKGFKLSGIPVQVQSFLMVDYPELWWPWTMSDNFGYLYAFQVTIIADKYKDIYRQPVGLRTVEVTATQFLINGKPFYFQGFGKHEDADVRD